MTFLALFEGNATEWRVAPEELTDAIRAHWPDTVVDSSHHGETRRVTWQLPLRSGRGEAYLHEDGTCLYMDVWQDDAVRLTIALRGLMPESLDLVFCDDGYTFDVRVPDGTTATVLSGWIDAAA